VDNNTMFIIMTTLLVAAGVIRLLFMMVEAALGSTYDTYDLVLFLIFIAIGGVGFGVLGHFGASDNLRLAWLIGCPAILLTFLTHGAIYKDSTISDFMVNIEVGFFLIYGWVLCGKFG